jgi:acetyl esterase
MALAVEIPMPPPEVLEFLRTLRVPAGSDEDALFAAQTAAMLAEPWPDGVTVRRRVPIAHGDVSLDGDIVLPSGGDEWPLLLYVHGGGWDSGSPGSHRRIACELAARGFAVVVPRYRLGPAHRHPAQLDDLDATLAWARETPPMLGQRLGALPWPGRAGDPPPTLGRAPGALPSAERTQGGLCSPGRPPGAPPSPGEDTRRLVVAGDSAGAHLAAALAVRRRLAGRDDIDAAILLTGIFDYHRGLPLVGPHGWDGDPASQPLLDPAEFEALREDPVVNPLRGAAHLPPTFVAAGAEDPFAPQSRELYEALVAAGVPAAFAPGEGMPHLWHLLPGLPGAATALDRAAAWALDQVGAR